VEQQQQESEPGIDPKQPAGETPAKTFHPFNSLGI